MALTVLCLRWRGGRRRALLDESSMKALELTGGSGRAITVGLDGRTSVHHTSLFTPLCRAFSSHLPRVPASYGRWSSTFLIWQVELDGRSRRLDSALGDVTEKLALAQDVKASYSKFSGEATPSEPEHLRNPSTFLPNPSTFLEQAPSSYGR